jgi:DNA modification methylase
VTVTIHRGDTREVLKTLPAESVQTVVTSPPYYGLRSYLPDGHADKGKEIGLEQSPQEYVDQLVAVFREVRRVLRKDGTAWLNLGDSYNNFRTQKGPGQAVHGRDKLNGKPAPLSGGWGSAGFKEKDLLMIPNRVAIALQDDGWWVRSEIIWAKAAPMPESVRDRPTCAHEKVWLLTKAATYFYDADAVREPYAGPMYEGRNNGAIANGDRADRGKTCGMSNPDGRNLRNVWHLNPEPSGIAHFAMMPTKLAETCIKAGTSEKGQCPHCGSPWVRVVEREPGFEARRQDDQGMRGRRTGAALDSDYRGVGYTRSQMLGWQPSCACPAHEPVPQTVLDPFAGAGTTLLVADRLQRHGIGIELNPVNVDIATRRIHGDAPLFAEAV